MYSCTFIALGLSSQNWIPNTGCQKESSRWLKQSNVNQRANRKKAAGYVMNYVHLRTDSAVKMLVALLPRSGNMEELNLGRVTLEGLVGPYCLVIPSFLGTLYKV